jgi:hydrogenase expression/formation protein HypE
MRKTLPVGKLPPDLLRSLLAHAPVGDPRVLLGPGIGIDCAVIDHGETLLVYKSDPITFATDEIGWYAVQVNANDIATTGAVPRWMLVTLLLPEGETTEEMVEKIGNQIFSACREIGVALVGGHTEITSGLRRPVLVGTLIGEVRRDRLVTPRGAQPGNRVLLTKGVPIEATALLAREFPEMLRSVLSEAEIDQARDFLYHPGISVLRDAQIATRTAQVTAMHDPTEGGLVGGLWELAEASGHTVVIDAQAVPVYPLSRRICNSLSLDPLAAIASGSLLLTAPSDQAPKIQRALEAEGIACAEIGGVEVGPPVVWRLSPAGHEIFTRPERDEIASLFERGKHPEV